VRFVVVFVCIHVVLLLLLPIATTTTILLALLCSVFRALPLKVPICFSKDWFGSKPPILNYATTTVFLSLTLQNLIMVQDLITDDHLYFNLVDYFIKMFLYDVTAFLLTILWLLIFYFYEIWNDDFPCFMLLLLLLYYMMMRFDVMFGLMYFALRMGDCSVGFCLFLWKWKLK
jgi:hypothetical protein